MRLITYQGSLFSGCLMQLVSITKVNLSQQLSPHLCCNLGNNSVVKTTDLFLQCGTTLHNYWVTWMLLIHVSLFHRAPKQLPGGVTQRMTLHYIVHELQCCTLYAMVVVRSSIPKTGNHWTGLPDWTTGICWHN